MGTIPNVVMNWCRKKAHCAWDSCNVDSKAINIGEAMVTVIFWNKGNPDSRRWNYQQCYHPQCWVEQGLDYLHRNPFVPHKRGRTSVLSKEDARKKFLLVRKFNTLYSRKKNIIVGYPDSLIIEANLTKQMLDIMLEVAVLGGIPKGWVDKL